MPRVELSQQAISRTDAIALLRQELVARTDEETSCCLVAARQGIFCRGFAVMSDAELRQRYDWIVQRRPDITRVELEQVANLWQLARQDVNDLPLACDVQRRERDACRGWDGFSNDALARYYSEITGRAIVIA